ncbi:MutS-related protein [Salarchaeum japonicum]|uniref:DNA mismatch repair proteins mutS family domain-containing protein n=1 Tax=Salarchaeum japonicum TaxID=555573 RepID=A0AAV3T265_9EURY|nr:DNA mismatch repair protein [Salarchaeum japonicum]
MRLEDYWGVGPKTAALLDDSLGTEAAVAAIESADSRTLVDAGLSRGRATRILRRANGGDGMDVLATEDARAVYKDIVSLAESYAVTDHAADRVRVLTPLLDRDAVEARLDRVTAAVESWRALDDATRTDVLDAFERYDDAGGTDRAAVDAALVLRETGLHDGVFAPLADCDPDALADAADALQYLDGERVTAGADARLDELRDAHADAERLERDTFDVLEEIRGSGVRGTEEFREAFVAYVREQTAIDPSRAREAMGDGATDAADFLAATARALETDLAAAVESREDTVRTDLRERVDAAREDVDAAVEAVSNIAFYLSIARFADAFDLTRPDIVETDTIAVVGARNLSLRRDGVDVQPVTYGVGDHSTGDAPSGDRVTVLTGANSGGKTTLLETLCQVALLAQMGLPVPADSAEVGLVDALVFHRRHASFNAGVLESTLRSVVPPLSGDRRTLMLVDEFEAITEPGSAADLLHGLVTLTGRENALGVYVTHLADDLAPLPGNARIDGIFAEGLTPDLELAVDYQPRFDTVGKSTPEFIVSRLVAETENREEQAAFRTLADAVGHDAVQRTLADAEWTQ